MAEESQLVFLSSFFGEVLALSGVISAARRLYRPSRATNLIRVCTVEGPAFGRFDAHRRTKSAFFSPFPRCDSLRWPL